MVNIVTEETEQRKRRIKHPIHVYLKKLDMSRYKGEEVAYFTTKAMRFRMARFLMCCYRIYLTKKETKNSRPHMFYFDDVVSQQIFSRSFKFVFTDKNYLRFKTMMKRDMWIMASAGYLAIGKIKKKEKGAWKPSRLYIVLTSRGVAFVESVIKFNESSNKDES